MAVHFITSDAKALLTEFNKRISQTDPKEKITTWRKNSARNLYTHEATQWSTKAWLRPKIEDTQLTFNIIKPPGKTVISAVYAYYHGHLIETFLGHFDEYFESCIASALAEFDDDV